MRSCHLLCCPALHRLLRMHGGAAGEQVPYVASVLIFELPFPEHMSEDVMYETLRRLLGPVAAPPRALSAAQEEQVVRCRANVRACYTFRAAAGLSARACTAAARAFAADLSAAAVLLTSSTSQARALRALPCVALRALSS